jgi:hypothetical protein
MALKPSEKDIVLPYQNGYAGPTCLWFELTMYPSLGFTTWGTMLYGTEPEMYSEPKPGIIAPGLYDVPEKIG